MLHFSHQMSDKPVLCTFHISLLQREGSAGWGLARRHIGDTYMHPIWDFSLPKTIHFSMFQYFGVCMYFPGALSCPPPLLEILDCHKNWEFSKSSKLKESIHLPWKFNCQILQIESHVADTFTYSKLPWISEVSKIGGKKSSRVPFTLPNSFEPFFSHFSHILTPPNQQLGCG